MGVPVAEDLSHPPEVGKRYLVRVVRVAGQTWFARIGTWVSVYGSVHSDPEIGRGASYPHYHLFIPFLPEKTVRIAKLHERDSFYLLNPGASLFAQPLYPKGDVGRSNWFDAERMAILKCKRAWPEFPTFRLPGAAKDLARYAVPLRDCWRCPHRGFNLRLVSPDANGVITCPGHGLRWHAASGLPVVGDQ